MERGGMKLFVRLLVLAAGITAVTMLLFLLHRFPDEPGPRALLSGSAHGLGKGGSSLERFGCTGDRLVVGPGYDDGTGLDGLVCSLWLNKYREAGVFKASLDEFTTRSLTVKGPGRHSYIVAANLGRSQKRRTYQPAELRAIVRPFDTDKFSFNAVDLRREALFMFEPSPSTPAQAVCTRQGDGNAMAVEGRPGQRSGGAQRARHAVLINPFPLGKCSGLIAAHLGEDRNQLMREDALRVGLAFATGIRSPWFRLGYNSLGGGASVNHFHFQFWKLAAVLPAEVAEAQTVAGRRAGPGLRVEQSRDFPVRFLAFRGFRASNITAVAAAAQHCIDWLVAHGLPHNLCINRDDLYILPRRADATTVRDMAFGFPELSGELITPSRASFEGLAAAEVAAFFRDHVSLPPAQFAAWTRGCT